MLGRINQKKVIIAIFVLTIVCGSSVHAQNGQGNGNGGNAQCGPNQQAPQPARKGLIPHFDIQNFGSTSRLAQLTVSNLSATEPLDFFVTIYNRNGSIYYDDGGQLTGVIQTSYSGLDVVEPATGYSLTFTALPKGSVSITFNPFNAPFGTEITGYAEVSYSASTGAQLPPVPLALAAGEYQLIRNGIISIQNFEVNGGLAF